MLHCRLSAVTLAVLALALAASAVSLDMRRERMAERRRGINFGNVVNAVKLDGANVVDAGRRLEGPTKAVAATLKAGDWKSVGGVIDTAKKVAPIVDANMGNIKNAIAVGKQTWDDLNGVPRPKTPPPATPVAPPTPAVPVPGAPGKPAPPLPVPVAPVAPPTPQQPGIPVVMRPKEGPCPNCNPVGASFTVKSAPSGLRDQAKTLADIIEKAGAIPAGVDKPAPRDADEVNAEIFKGYLHEILGERQMAKMAERNGGTTVNYVTMEADANTKAKRQTEEYLKTHGKLRPLSQIRAFHDRLFAGKALKGRGNKQL